MRSTEKAQMNKAIELTEKEMREQVIGGQGGDTIYPPIDPRKRPKTPLGFVNDPEQPGNEG
jgi:hypothetical protein